jgi:TolB-like protein
LLQNIGLAFLGSESLSTKQVHNNMPLSQQVMKMKKIFLFCLAGCLLAALGCYLPRNIITASYSASDRLMKNAPAEISTETPILVASFVNISNLEQSSDLGRLISEQISSRLAQKGYHVKEVKLSKDSIFVKQGNGEFILSRRLQHIRTSFKTNYVIVGTYSTAKSYVYVNARIVRIEDNRIVSSYDFRLPGDTDLWELAGDHP